MKNLMIFSFVLLCNTSLIFAQKQMFETNVMPKRDTYKALEKVWESQQDRKIIDKMSSKGIDLEMKTKNIVNTYANLNKIDTLKESEPLPPAAFTKIERKATFSEGVPALVKFLSENVHYPQMAIEHSVIGTVILKFSVAQDGAIENIRVVESLGYGCDEEAIRVLQLTAGKWTPANQNGRSVRCGVTLPFRFNLF